MRKGPTVYSSEQCCCLQTCTPHIFFMFSSLFIIFSCFVFFWIYRRKVQIDELVKEFPDISVIDPNELFSVSLRDPRGQVCQILIDLPPDFPNGSGPLLLCEPVIQHEWILPTGQVQGHEYLKNWRAEYSLVKVITDLQGEFRKNQNQNKPSKPKPTITTTNTNASESLSKKTINTTTNTTANTGSPRLSMILNEHDSILLSSISELQATDLLKCEDKFKKFMDNFTSASEKLVLQEQLKRDNLTRAQGNLKIVEEIEELAIKLNQTHAEYLQAVQSYNNFISENESQLHKLDSENLITQIEVNLMELNDFTTKSLKSSLNSGLTSDSDVKEYVVLRKKYHKRAILLQKYHLLNK